MNRSLIIGAIALVTVLCAPGRALADDSSAVHYYLSLGDSLAESYQPNGDLQHGYAEQLYALLKVDDPKLRLVKLGCGGETSLSTVDPYLPYEGRGAGYHCDFPHGSQLAEAVSFLHAHAGFVRAVTIDIGGNDFLEFGDRAPDVIRANLTQIVDELGAAAGPNVPIVGMNYYDPFLPALWRESRDLGALEAAVGSVVGLNDVLEAIYSDAGDPVADVEGTFRLTDTRVVDGEPIDVSLECAWTWFCSRGDIHANTTGYGAIAQAFGAALQLPYVDDVFTQPFIGLPQYSCPQGYGGLILYQKPASDPLWLYDQNHDAVICKRIH
jgi:lysophospholipase L1-like esterase